MYISTIGDKVIISGGNIATITSDQDTLPVKMLFIPTQEVCVLSEHQK